MRNDEFIFFLFSAVNFIFVLCDLSRLHSLPLYLWWYLDSNAYRKKMQMTIVIIIFIPEEFLETDRTPINVSYFFLSYSCALVVFNHFYIFNHSNYIFCMHVHKTLNNSQWHTLARIRRVDGETVVVKQLIRLAYCSLYIGANPKMDHFSEWSFFSSWPTRCHSFAKSSPLEVVKSSNTGN